MNALSTLPDQASLAESFPGRQQVWSATPTPFLEDGRLDLAGVGRMTEWHLRQKISGMMVLGTCGEGPWMTESQRRELVREIMVSSAGRMPIGVQVTENSAPRVLEQIDFAAAAGADYVALAQPYFLFPSHPAAVSNFYRTIFDRSALPVIFYDRGRHPQFFVPEEILPEIALHPKVEIIKDSSADFKRWEIFLSAKAQRPDLTVLAGDEFNSLKYLQTPGDGLMLGGGIINAPYIRRIISHLAAGDSPGAQQVDSEMREMLLMIYGGPGYPCWLAGLKHLLVELGVFTTSYNIPGYTVSEECRQNIAAFLRRTHPWA